MQHAAHGRDRAVSGGSRPASRAGAPVGVKRSAPVASPVRKPPRGRGPGARHRLPRHHHAPDQEGGVLTYDGPDRRGYPDPALRYRTQPQGPLPTAAPRWG